MVIPVVMVTNWQFPSLNCLSFAASIPVCTAFQFRAVFSFQTMRHLGSGRAERKANYRGAMQTGGKTHFDRMNHLNIGPFQIIPFSTISQRRLEYDSFWPNSRCLWPNFKLTKLDILFWITDLCNVGITEIISTLPAPLQMFPRVRSTVGGRLFGWSTVTWEAILWGILIAHFPPSVASETSKMLLFYFFCLVLFFFCLVLSCNKYCREVFGPTTVI